MTILSRRLPARNLHGTGAFTLAELLVVISVVGVLAGVALPVFSSARKTADKATCIAHLKQIVTATNLDANDKDGAYPNMCGYGWEPGANTTGYPWIATELAPYVGGVANQDPTKLLRCPAAEKNSQQAWLKDSMYCHYRYNVYRYDPSGTPDPNTGYPKPASRPTVSFANAMVFFDTTFNDWAQNTYAHSPGGSGTLVNVAYADGHVASLAYADFKRLNPTGGEANNAFFHLGWNQ